MKVLIFLIFIAFSINYKLSLQQEFKPGTRVETSIDITLKSVTNWFNRWQYRLNYVEWTDTGNPLVDPVLDVIAMRCTHLLQMKKTFRSS